MKNKMFKVFVLVSIASFVSCSENKTIVDKTVAEATSQEIAVVKTEPHEYGGWYCPDNLNGFPPVDIANWKNVPVVNGRMPTKEETQNGTSLIFVDAVNYPNAKPLDMEMPKLASFYNKYSKREDLVIVIQAVNVNNDSIVGFRYLNGGNGSARINEVRFLSENEIEMIPASRYVSQNVQIKATQDAIWEVLTNPKNAIALQSAFDGDDKPKISWREASNVNYNYSNKGKLTSSYAGELFGNFYIQNDYDNFLYNEKFLLLEDKETQTTELKIVCGPYANDFESQKRIINYWAQKVKELSEKK
jgi:hypothetical protein